MRFFVSVCDPKKVRVGGRGLQPTGLRVGDVADIQIYTDGCGEGKPEVILIVPGRISIWLNTYNDHSRNWGVLEPPSPQKDLNYQHSIGLLIIYRKQETTE